MSFPIILHHPGSGPGNGKLKEFEENQGEVVRLQGRVAHVADIIRLLDFINPKTKAVLSPHNPWLPGGLKFGNFSET